MSDGAIFDISHPDQVLFAGSLIYIGVGRKGPTEVDHVERCSLLHVTRLAESNPSR